MPCSTSNCPFFELQAEDGLRYGDEMQCIIRRATQKVIFRKGQVLFLQGQLSSSLYSLTEGMVKICLNTAEGHEQIVGLSSPGNLLVGLQSLNDEHYAYTGIAETAVSACKINHKALLACVRDKGEIALRLVVAVNAQLAHSRALMEVLGHKCAAAKVASFLLLMMPKSEQGNCRFALPFSRMEIANLLGLSEETVCRLMANMKRAGAIYAPRGSIEVRDWKKLHAISDGNAGEYLVA
jgi:CRP/FNR family transcriptional regulator